MDKDVLIAIIATITAVVTSVISLITSLLSAKRTEKANQSLERLRLDQEQVKLLLGIKKESFEESLKALENTCVVIQKCKDELRNYLSEIEQNKKNKTSTNANNACEDLVLHYQKMHYLLISEHRQMLHELKNKSIDAQGVFHYLARSSSTDNRENAINTLKVFIDELGITQTTFLEYRDKMISTIGVTSK